jgi:hypothetical protein
MPTATRQNSCIISQYQVHAIAFLKVPIVEVEPALMIHRNCHFGKPSAIQAIPPSSMLHQLCYFRFHLRKGCPHLWKQPTKRAADVRAHGRALAIFQQIWDTFAITIHP